MLLLWIVLSPAGAAGVRERGAELEAAHRWDDAVRLYRAALDDSPDSPTRFWLLTSLAEIEFNRQEYDAAERWLRQAEQVVEAPADRLRLLTARGTLHLVRGNLTAAARDLSRAVDLTAAGAPPEDCAAALHNLAAVEMRLGRLDAALDHQTLALQLWRDRLGDRNDYVWKAWIGLSSVQGLQANWRAAGQSIRRALAIRESEEALVNYAVVLGHLKRAKEAKAIRSRLHNPAAPASTLLDVNAATQAVRSR